MQHIDTQLAQKPRRAIVGHPGDPESGVVLLAVIFLTFLLLLSLAIAAPNLARKLQRQKEEETIQRGLQYEQAIRLYYIKFGHYPTKMKDLLDTNGMRFLRQQYKDPLTGKDDWKLVLYGQAHVHPLGFFGKPLTAAGAAATNVTALSGGMYAISHDSSVPGAPGGSDNSQNSNSDSNIFGPSSGSATAGSSSTAANGSDNSFGSTPGSGSSVFSSSTSSGGLGGTSSSDSNGFGSNIPFVGVVPPLKKPSIIAFRKQKNYDRWEFNYDPVVDQAMAAVSLLGGGSNNLNGSNSANSGNSNNSGSGFGNDNSGFGNNTGGFGNNNDNGFGNSNTGNNSNSNSNSNPNPDSNPNSSSSTNNDNSPPNPQP